MTIPAYHSLLYVIMLYHSLLSVIMLCHSHLSEIMLYHSSYLIMLYHSLLSEIMLYHSLLSVIMLCHSLLSAIMLYIPIMMKRSLAACFKQNFHVWFNVDILYDLSTLVVKTTSAWIIIKYNPPLILPRYTWRWAQMVSINCTFNSLCVFLFTFVSHVNTLFCYSHWCSKSSFLNITLNKLWYHLL